MKRLAVIISLAGLLGACGKGRAGSLSADLDGTWDVTYDDAIDVAVRVGEELLSVRVGEHGGRITMADGGVDFTLDCKRPELVCPGEVWPRELQLGALAGELEQDGAQLVRWLGRLGEGPCAVRPGSIITAELMTTASATAVRPEAVALTSGRVTTIVSDDCLAIGGGLPKGAQVSLTTGFSAAKR